MSEDELRVKIAMFCYMLLEQQLGRTRHGSVLGLANNIVSAILNRLSKKKDKK